MNALDALFSRQVPTRSSGGISGAGAEIEEGAAFGARGSFASALSGEYSKQRQNLFGEVKSETEDGQLETDDITSDITNADDLLAELAVAFDLHFGTGRSASPDKSDDQAAEAATSVKTDALTGDDPVAEDLAGDAEIEADTNTNSAVTPPLADLTKAAATMVSKTGDGAVEIASKQENGKKPSNTADANILQVPSKISTDTSADVVSRTNTQASAQAIPDPRSTLAAGRKQAVEASATPSGADEKSNRAMIIDHAAREKQPAGSRAQSTVMSNGEVALEPDVEIREGQVGQGRDQAGKAIAGRADQDKAMDKIHVIERRTIAAPQASQNGEAVAKALVQDAAQFAQSTRGEAIARQSAAAPMASTTNPAAITQASAPKTLHTLSIQLNPHSLGQVTAVLKMTGDELSVELKVQTAEAYRQLKEDSTAIVKALRAQGYGVETISIQHVPPDRQPMASQQGQQFQFQDGDARSASGNQSGANRQHNQTTRDGNFSGESTHDHQGSSADGFRRSDGVYL